MRRNTAGPQLFALLYSKSPCHLTRYGNPKMDEMLLATRQSPTMDERMKHMCDVVRLMNDEAPIQYRGGRKHYVVTRKGIEGLRPLYAGTPDVRYLTVN